MRILLNMRILNIIHKHLLKENNNQNFEIRYSPSPCRIFPFLVKYFCECAFIEELLWK